MVYIWMCPECVLNVSMVDIWMCPDCVSGPHLDVSLNVSMVDIWICPECVLNVSMVDTWMCPECVNGQHPPSKLLWVYCPRHAGVKGNDRADRLGGQSNPHKWLVSRKI